MSKRYVVRFGSTRNVAEFTARDSDDFPRMSDVVIRSDRGIEWGVILCLATERTANYLNAESPAGKILRLVSADDRREEDARSRREFDFFARCRQMIEDHKLQMDLVDVEQLFGGERLIFYYVAEKRVDFRDLVKSLAKEFRTRIEMRQIGVRDEAKLLADYGDCGKPVCCNTHLHEMPPVSMKMAKLQKPTLDPAKISGRCGRLKCCLRYEFDTYKEHRRELPNVGTLVVTKLGQGKVVGQEILAKKVIVSYEGRRNVLTDLPEILTVIKSGGGAKKSAEKRSPGKSNRGPAAETDE